eukprot:TRINITY_DN3745_c0_g1_i5.p1 TRINITY_DN3745_c0_g1~~TRINITY_DN3745_c0_g1_i5.p1  ORF type:complete len:378 (-),score=50.36 TRINITY_DN3745_c0_g1_i5:624-1757(-)
MEQQTSSAAHEEILKQLWSILRENPTDFASWSLLIQTIDQKPGNIEAVRKAYDSFLAEYPLCYVYWKKYADHESTIGEPTRVVDVYERGLVAIPHSVDLWCYYCTYTIDKVTDLSAIRSLFVRATGIVGIDYLAWALWDKYLEWETVQNEIGNIIALYRRILSIPLETLAKYHERWKAFAATRPCETFLLAEQIEGVDEADRKAKILKQFDDLYNAAVLELTRRLQFEQVVKERPYFHVKPMPENDLAVWHKYLTFEEKEGNTERIRKLYERCLIPCCNYPEFWRRYIHYLHEHDGVQAARQVWQRAAFVHLKRRPDINMEYALFEEANGDTERAVEVLEQLRQSQPNHIEVVVRLAETRRRQKDVAASGKNLGKDR